MRHDDYVAEREARDPAFRAACEAFRPEYERERARIARRLEGEMSGSDLLAEWRPLSVIEDRMSQVASHDEADRLLLLVIANLLGHSNDTLTGVQVARIVEAWAKVVG